MPTMRASLFSILRPVKLLTLAHFAKIAGKWANFKEAKKREKFTNAVLNRRSRKTPFVCGIQRKARTSDTSCTLLLDISTDVV